ncbi:MAG: sugar ABC transporter ATP-binding protein [Elusimicrobiota bacterium]
MPILSGRGLVKEFPGVVALKGVSFELLPGEIHALCGENGAGKSTLIKLLCGIHPHGSYKGELRVDGKEARFSSVADAEEVGIAVICQELALVPEMSAAENIFLGAEPLRGAFIDWPKVFEEGGRLLRKFGVDVDPRVPTRELGTGKQQLVEIVKALRKEARILILDEPTSALTESESAILLGILKDLRKRGISCVYISHKLDEVFAVADRITVLRDGASVSTLEAPRTDRAEIIRLMVGRDIQDLFPRRSSATGRTRLRVQDLSVAAGEGAEPFLKNVSFKVRAGEVVGLGGLMGAGRTELLMHLFGAWGRRISGRVELDGGTLPAAGPDASIRAGLALVSEDRRRYGLVLDQSVGFNLSLSHLHALTRNGLIDTRIEADANACYFDSLKIKAPSQHSRVGGLSGGNQQKVVIGRVLMPEPVVVMLDEPTRGIDVGAKIEVYEIINRLTAQGIAVLLASSELPELMGMSDRILMLHEGKVSGEFSRAEATQEKLLAAAMGEVKR